tara:strand:- start:381 stop:587 length:207 start_codon:yes stop_codon:yes gene_type:complete
MKLYNNAIQTDRAFIHFDKIQHYSWAKVLDDDYDVKIYSNAGYIIQNMTEEEYKGFMNNYSQFKGVSS